jgi:hypothetical protein
MAASKIVHITLGRCRKASPDDPLGRSWLGYDPHRSATENWEANRGAWKLNPQRVNDCDLAVFSHKGLVVLVARVTGVESVPDQGGYWGRWRLVGTPLTSHPLEGRPQPAPRSSGNPIAYGSIDLT